jgi:hypothetical protein
LTNASSWFKDEDEDEDENQLKGAATAFLPRPIQEACDEWRHVWPEIALVMYKPKDEWSDYQFEIQRTWDELVSPQYRRTSVADLADFHAMYPLADSEPVIQGMLSDLDGWGRLRDDFDHLNSTVCVNVALGSRSRPPRYHGQVYGSNNASDRLQRRSVQPDMHGNEHSARFPDPSGQIPSLGIIFEGIRNNQYSL